MSVLSGIRVRIARKKVGQTHELMGLTDSLEKKNINRMKNQGAHYARCEKVGGDIRGAEDRMNLGWGEIKNI